MRDWDEKPYPADLIAVNLVEILASVFTQIYNLRLAIPAGVAKLVDALDSKSSFGNKVSVRVRPPAPFLSQIIY